MTEVSTPMPRPSCRLPARFLAGAKRGISLPVAPADTCPDLFGRPAFFGLLWARRLPRLGRGVLSALLCALCVSAFSSPLFAQSCALCYESARNSGNPGAIDRGILVLLLPTLLLFVGVLVFTVRRANPRE